MELDGFHISVTFFNTIYLVYYLILPTDFSSEHLFQMFTFLCVCYCLCVLCTVYYKAFEVEKFHGFCE